MCLSINKRCDVESRSVYLQRTRKMLGIICVCLVLAASVTTADNAESNPQDCGPVVHSPSGMFRGSWMRTRRGRLVQAFRGVRYAEPPVGELRFQPPKLITQYVGEVNATANGPACPQLTRPGYYVDEDCLTINVYTPGEHSSELLPVIFFIHPGGFYSMNGRSDLFGPDYMLDRNVVLVTINYRLATLGYLALGTAEAPGNNGLKDQVAALRWVQRNIAAFGGDPNLVTITGCSAGSISVMLHMISPMSKGLFHRAIALSGSPTSKVPTPTHLMSLAIRQAEILKCPTDNASAIYECLKSKDWQDYAQTVRGFFEFGFDPLRLWEPVVELDFGQERFLTMDPMQAIREGKMHTVPYIISTTTDEFFWKAFTILNNQTLLDTMNSEWDRIAPISFVLPRNETHNRLQRLREAYFGDKLIYNDSNSADHLGKLYGDAITAFPVHRMANLMCRHSQHAVYYAQFSYMGNHSFYEDPITMKPIRVAHHDDLLYLFPLSFRFPLIDVSSSLDSQMVDIMTAIWYNFARYGDTSPREDTPELSSLSWPPMTPEHRDYLRININFTVRQKLFEERYKIWEDLYPIQY